MLVWISAGRGIRYREHPTRKHGQRPDRYWCIRYTLDGRDVDEAMGWWSDGVTKAKCSEALAELRHNHRLGRGPRTLKELRQAEGERLKAEAARVAGQSGGMTLEEFREDYLKRLSVTASIRTVKWYAGFLNTWLKPLKDLPLCEITKDTLERLVVTPMLEKGLSPCSIERALGTFSAIWSDAKRLGIVSGKNPKTKTSRPKQDNRRDRFLTRDEARRLLAILKQSSPDAHDLCVLSLFSGLRVGECLTLTWSDIDMEGGQIFVKDTKNTCNRHAYLTAEIREMLLCRYQGQPKSEAVFALGTLSAAYLRILLGFNEAVKELKLNEGISDRRQKVVIHTLRHTFASWLVMMGKPLYTVSKLLGHRGIKHTQRYAHLAPSAKRAAGSNLEGFLKRDAASREKG